MRVLLLTLAFLLPSATGFGQSALYSFSGRVTGIQSDGAGTIAALGWAVGDPVSVSFEVDFGMPAMERLNDGSVSVLAPVVWEEESIGFFSARMVAGTLLPEVNGGMYNDPEDVSESLRAGIKPTGGATEACSTGGARIRISGWNDSIRGLVGWRTGGCSSGKWAPRCRDSLLASVNWITP